MKNAVQLHYFNKIMVVVRVYVSTSSSFAVYQSEFIYFLNCLIGCSYPMCRFI
jgi:hypothetical protein